MEIVKIPNMDKAEYDKLIEEGFLSRIAFQGAKYPPYIAPPFLYVFDGKFLYFLATKYGRKNDLFRQHPYVSVEIEKYSGDLSCYTFVTMQGGYLVQLEDAIEKKIIREKFVTMIKRTTSRRTSSQRSAISRRSRSRRSPPKSVRTSGN